MAIEQAFTWGGGGRKLTQEQIDNERKIAQALIARGTDYSPVASPWQGLARVAQGVEGAIDDRRAQAAQNEYNDYNSSLINGLIGASSPAAPQQSSMPSPGASAEMSAVSGQPAQIGGNQQAFIDSMLPAAIEEGRRTGIDPRIIVAQAAQETGWGKSAPGNNYFGIKSHGVPGGQTLATTEYVNGQPQTQTASFRGYASPEDSVRGYGDFMLQNPRYKSMREAQGLDAQLQALGTSGYATDPNYANSVGSIARSIQLPQQVAASTPQAAIEAISPSQQTAYAPADGVGVSPLPAPRTVSAAPAMAVQPAQMGSAPAAGVQTAALLRAISDPRASDGTRAVAQALLMQQQKQTESQAARDNWLFQQQYQEQAQARDPLRQAQIAAMQAKQDTTPEAVRALNIRAEQAGLQPGTPEYQQFMVSGGRGPLVNVNTGEGNKFYNTLDEKNAAIFSKLSDNGIQSRSNLAQIDQLDSLLKNSGSGWITALKQKAGDYGIATDGLSDIQAASALLSKMIPAQREPGSGPVSDADLAGFRNSLPRLINQPGGNAKIINTMRGLSQYQIAQGEIADKVANREMTPAEGRAAIANLPNPLANFSADSSRGGPKVGAVEDGYRFKGGNPSDPNSWEKVN